MDQPVTVRPFRPEDREVGLAVINRAAAWYREIVPADDGSCLPLLVDGTPPFA